MNNPKVCVVMPVYNGAATIELALKSLVAQTYSNWECVIVNDGSTDSTHAILDSLTDPRFKVIHLEKNVGRGAARQVALDNAEGDYLAYLDADDFYHEDKLLKQVAILDVKSNITLVGCRLTSFNSVYIPISVRGSLNTEPIEYNLGDSISLCMPTAMIRLKEAKSFTYNPKLNAAEDADYFSKYLNRKKYQNIPDILLFYSITESTTYSKILEYTGFEIKRGIYLFGNNNKAALKIIFTSVIKWLIYAFTIPFLGVDFFLKRRGRSVEAEEINTFMQQKNKTVKTTI